MLTQTAFLSYKEFLSESVPLFAYEEDREAIPSIQVLEYLLPDVLIAVLHRSLLLCDRLSFCKRSSDKCFSPLESIITPSSSFAFVLFIIDLSRWLLVPGMLLRVGNTQVGRRKNSDQDERVFVGVICNQSLSQRRSLGFKRTFFLMNEGVDGWMESH